MSNSREEKVFNDSSCKSKAFSVNLHFGKGDYVI